MFARNDDTQYLRYVYDWFPGGTVSWCCDIVESVGIVMLGKDSLSIAGLVAKAAKRFMNSINPPVQFGKPYHAEGATGERVSTATSSSYQSKGPGSAGSSENGASTCKGTRGHRSSYLFAPLAPEDVEA